MAGYVAGPGAPKTLTDAQIQQIIRLKQAKKTAKQIAKAVGCTPDQATHYWRSSPFAKSAGKREARRQLAQRRAALAKAAAAALAKRHAQEMADARAELATQLRLAREEAPHTEPFKRGAIEWPP